MNRGQIRYAMAAVAMLCTLAILLFPVAWGPYPATHGPVTSLKAMQAGILLWLSIVFAGLSLLAPSPQLAYSLALSGAFTFKNLLSNLRVTQASSILRC